MKLKAGIVVYYNSQILKRFVINEYGHKVLIFGM